MRLRIALFDRVTDPIAKVIEVEWPEIVSALTKHDIRLEKDGRGWSPVDMKDGARRGLANVAVVTLAVFDVDSSKGKRPLITSEVLSRVLTALDGLAYVLHTTHSSRHPDDWALRLVMPLSRSVNVAEWNRLREAFPRISGIPIDPNAADASRFFYFPSAPPDGLEPEAMVGEGVSLDVDAIVGMGRVGSSVVVPTVAPAPASVGVGPVDVEELREMLRRTGRESTRKLMRGVLAGEPLPPGEHDATLNRIAGAVAFAVPVDAPFDVLVEILRPCLMATDLCRDTPEQAWADHVKEFEDQLRRARGRRVESDSARDRLRNATVALITPREPGTAPDPGSDPADPTGEEDDQWKHQLQHKENADGQMVLEKDPLNAGVILGCAPIWRDAIKFNTVSKEIDVLGGPIQPVPDPATFAIEVRNWVKAMYGLGLKTREVEEQILAIAKRNKHDPLVTQLLSYRWDGTERVTSFLETYCHVEPIADGKDIAPYVRAVSAAWLISAAARALHPGCKVDTMLILEGPQGKKKSSLLKALGGEWYCDAPIDVHDKDSRIRAARYWICEIAELTAFQRADNAEALKAYLSTSEDKVRPPYGRVEESYPRRAVYAGTTNRADYLKDETGHRRFWPVQVGEIDVDAVARDRQQLWAEAVHRYQAGEKWWLEDPEVVAMAAEQARRRAFVNRRLEVFLRWWQETPLTQRPRELTAADAAIDAFDIPRGQVRESELNAIGQVLAALGFSSQWVSRSGVQQLVYTAPDSLLTSTYTPKRGGVALAAFRGGAGG